MNYINLSNTKILPNHFYLPVEFSTQVAKNCSFVRSQKDNLVFYGVIGAYFADEYWYAENDASISINLGYDYKDNSEIKPSWNGISFGFPSPEINAVFAELEYVPNNDYTTWTLSESLNIDEINENLEMNDINASFAYTTVDNKTFIEVNLGEEIIFKNLFTETPLEDFHFNSIEQYQEALSGNIIHEDCKPYLNNIFILNFEDSLEPEPVEPVIKSNYSLIADAIRSKTGKSDLMTAAQMPNEIESIETGESSTVLRVPFIVSERVYREKFPKLIIDTSKKWLRALSLDHGMEYDFQFGEWVYDSNYKPVMIDGQHVHFDFRENNYSLELALNHGDSQDFSMAQFNFVNTLEDDYIAEFGSLEYSGTEDILDFFTITEDNGIYIIEQNENYNIGLNHALEGCYSMHAEEKLVSIEGE